MQHFLYCSEMSKVFHFVMFTSAIKYKLFGQCFLFCVNVPGGKKKNMNVPGCIYNMDNY